MLTIVVFLSATMIRKAWDDNRYGVAQIGSQFRGTFELDAAPFDWGKDYKRPNLPAEDVIVYEMGVRSFTADESSNVGAGKEGTFAGLIAKVCPLL